MDKDKMAAQILAFMRQEAYKPLTGEELAAQLNLSGEALPSFWTAMASLEETAAIIKTRYGKYGVPERMNLLVGRLDMSSKGFGFVVSDNPDEPDVYISADAMHGAMHKDRVVARVHSGRQAGRRREGEIIRVVQRANTHVVGDFEGGRHFGFVTPDDPRIGRDVFIPKDDFGGARSGDKVVVEVLKWPEKRRSAEGRIVEILGHKGDPGIEILAIIKKYGLSVDFSPAVMRAAQHIPLSVSERELAGRRDLRDVVMVTIDSEDARDLDDAVHVEKLPDGRYLLGVHIADVSHYVKENGTLDTEARQRGTSVYLVDRVLPMLPPRLSNGICSLNAGEDRLAMSVHMEIDQNGKINHYEIFPSVIRVHTRLSYNIVRQVLVDKDPAVRAQYSALVPQLEEMERLCHILRARRMRRGAIDFDFPEIKVKLDEQGRPIDIVKKVRTIAESIVEEFMLAANETVAEHMNRLGMPFVYRVHEVPDTEKMEKLAALLHNFGYNLRVAEEMQPRMLQQVLQKIAGRPEERVISTIMLRSMKQARYEAENLGHFGLAARFYTHFTSPIRRYPDLIIHRIIHEALAGGGLTAKRRQKLTAALPEIAAHCSQQERTAMEAERETVDLKKAEYMAQFAGQRFPGIISSVTAFGMFVELENGVEGLVHVSTMDDDYYQFDENIYALIGERTKKTYHIGDAVEIVVLKANIVERTVDFALAPTEGTITEHRPAPPKRARRGGGKKEGQGAKPAVAKDGAGNAGRRRRKKSSRPAKVVGEH